MHDSDILCHDEDSTLAIVHIVKQLQNSQPTKNTTDCLEYAVELTGNMFVSNYETHHLWVRTFETLGQRPLSILSLL